MGRGMPNIDELRDIGAARATAPAAVFTSTTIHEQMVARGIVTRECLASDTSQNPLPIMYFLDTSGSMGHVPQQLATHDLPRTLIRFTEMGSVGSLDPQICFCGVADYSDRAPIQIGQFERDNRMDDWLTRMHLGGGAGSEHMHEAYPLALYAAAHKTTCDIWKNGKKGYVFITGDEMCPKTLSKYHVRQIFGDDVPQDISTEQLIEALNDRWNLFFLYVATNSYRENTVETIWKHWQKRLGKNAIRLDANATALPEITSALIGITEGHYKASEVPKNLVSIGCTADIVRAAALALNVPDTDSKQAAPSPRKRGARPV